MKLLMFLIFAFSGGVSAASEGSARADEDKSAVWGSGIGHIHSVSFEGKEYDVLGDIYRKRINTSFNLFGQLFSDALFSFSKFVTHIQKVFFSDPSTLHILMNPEDFPHLCKFDMGAYGLKAYFDLGDVDYEKFSDAEQKIAPFVFFGAMASRFPKRTSRCLTHILNNLDSPDCDSTVIFFKRTLDNFSAAQVKEITLFIEDLVNERRVMLDLDRWTPNLQNVARLTGLMFEDIEPVLIGAPPRRFGTERFDVFEDIL